MVRRSKNKKAAKAKADKYFSEYIRLRDIETPCCTCGTNIRTYHNNDGKIIVEGDCGHFITRDNENTRYDERNANLQCHACNRFKSGKQYEHGLFIDKKFGEGTARELLEKSRMPASPRIQYDYETIAEEFKNKLFKQL